ncbi:MAG: flotillin-like FloA family protein, partial [Puniceicoccaceae bacterium]|nr:flotillin-like FloA family protein [Puniceicoccaceae bacterium]
MNSLTLPLADWPFTIALAGWQLGAAAILGLILLIGFFIIISFFSIWLRALLSGAPVGFPTLVAMRLRGVPSSLIVDARITSVKAGIEISANDLEAHYLAEGNVIQTV